MERSSVLKRLTQEQKAKLIYLHEFGIDGHRCSAAEAAAIVGCHVSMKTKICQLEIPKEST